MRFIDLTNEGIYFFAVTLRNAPIMNVRTRLKKLQLSPNVQYKQYKVFFLVFRTTRIYLEVFDHQTGIINVFIFVHLTSSCESTEQAVFAA